jgi:flavin-dependent dehydrogenase
MTETAPSTDGQPAKPSSSNYDVAILGGGLAGLTLALQLKRARPETSIFVAEKRAGPAPDAAFKVGESSVEVGAYYYREICGLADHLESQQLRKRGLRFFMTAGDNSDITKRVEFSTPYFAGLWTHQIDRGRFENEIARRVQEAGVDLIQGAFVDELDIGSGGDGHAVTIVQGGPGGERTRVESRWLVDASGRAGLVKRKLGLERLDIGHHINSSWIRLDKGLDLEDWGADDEEWIGRVEERGIRKFGTVHLTGEGYWVWLILLATPSISIGVVADPRFHPYERLKDLDSWMEWMHEHEPQLASKIEARRDEVLDFLSIEDFAYGVERVYSPDRWCLVGEAGPFLDPLYSPGSDFIAYGNTFTGDLIVRDLNGEDIDNRLELFNFLFFQLFNPSSELYRDMYQVLGNPQVMVAKQLYDNFTYFATLAFVFLSGRLPRPEVMFEISDVFVERAIPLLQAVQAFFREWNALERREYQGVSVLVEEFPAFHERQRRCVTEYDDEGFKEAFKENMNHVEAVAVVLFHWAARLLPDKPGDDVRIDPRAISLDPDRWEADGLYADDGISYNEAMAMLPGIEESLLEERESAVTA